MLKIFHKVQYTKHQYKITPEACLQKMETYQNNEWKFICRRGDTPNRTLENVRNLMEMEETLHCQ